MKNVYTFALLVMMFFASTKAYSQVTLLNETFNGPSLPAGWTTINNSVLGETGGPTAAAWTLRDNNYYYNSFSLPDYVFQSNDASRFYLSNSDAQGDDEPILPTTNTILQLPLINTSGYTSVTLQFYHSFSTYTSADSALVEASLDGINWTKVYTANFPVESEIGTPTNFVLQTVNLDAYANQPVVYLRFHYWAEFGYFWAIDNVTITAAGTALPVQLVSFSGYRNGNKNSLNWSTSSESNNRGFQVERSGDGVQFTQIGFVNSLSTSGNSSSELRYVFDDLDAGGAKQFYRLRQVDIDGRSTFSNTVFIDAVLPKFFSIANLFPVPVQNKVNVLVNAPKAEPVQLSIIDVRGVVMQHQKEMLNPGTNNINLDAERLPSGQYFLRIYSEATKQSYLKPFIKN